MERLFLANRGQRLPYHLVVDNHMIASYLLFILCLILLCYDQIQIKKNRKND